MSRGADVAIEEQVSSSRKFVAVIINMLQFLHSHFQG